MTSHCISRQKWVRGKSCTQIFNSGNCLNCRKYAWLFDSMKRNRIRSHWDVNPRLELPWWPLWPPGNPHSSVWWLDIECFTCLLYTWVVRSHSRLAKVLLSSIFTSQVYLLFIFISLCPIQTQEAGWDQTEETVWVESSWYPWEVLCWGQPKDHCPCPLLHHVTETLECRHCGFRLSDLQLNCTYNYKCTCSHDS